MEKPNIKPLDMNNINKDEKFIVFKPCWIAQSGKASAPFKKGDEVTLTGESKKDLYYQNKIMYPGDFEKVVAYEKESKENYQAQYEQAENPLTDSNKKIVEQNKVLQNQVSDLTKQNIDLTKGLEELKAAFEELKKTKK